MKYFSISLVGISFAGTHDCCLFSQESLSLSSPLFLNGRLHLDPLLSQAEQTEHHLPHVLQPSNLLHWLMSIFFFISGPKPRNVSLDVSSRELNGGIPLP